MLPSVNLQKKKKRKKEKAGIYYNWPVCAKSLTATQKIDV